MTSKHQLSVALVGMGLAVVTASQAGCGSSTTAKGTGAANAGSTSTSTTTSTTTSTSVSTGVAHTVGSSTSGSGGGGTGGTGGATPAGNHDPADAIAIPLNQSPAQAGTLVDVNTPDFYTFTTTTAGDRLFIGVVPNDLPSGVTSSAAAITPIYSIFATAADAMAGTPQLTYVGTSYPNQGQNAQDYVEIATPGTYYLKVQDCIGAFTQADCPNPASGISLFGYAVIIDEAAKNIVSTELNATAAQNGTTANAQPAVYSVPQGGTAGEYGEVVIDGNFKSATDTHVFTITPPADIATMAGATARADFFVQAINGSGMMDEGGDLSDSNVKIWLTDSTGTTILGQASQSNYVNFNPLDFSVPITAGSKYYLFVQNTQASGSATKDFYFIRHFFNPFIDQSETELAGTCGTNDTSATAQVLTAQNKVVYAPDGHIAPTGTANCTGPDVDWYSITVPVGTTEYALQCEAGRAGSGLTGFNAEFYQSDGTTAIGTKYTETATADISDQNYNPLPSAVKAGDVIFLKVGATGQDTTNTGTYYRCFAFFN